MNPFLIMEQHKDQFTPNDLRIYQAILENPAQVTYQSTNKLAESFGVSQPALTRFVRVLGYSRYQDFRNDITAWIARDASPADTSRLSYFERLERLLKETEQVLSESYMNELADYVLGFRRIFATGIGKSMNPAYLLFHLFQKHDIFPIPAQLDTLNSISDQISSSDLVIVFSVSAQSEIMERFAETNGNVLLVTTNGAHRYKEIADRTVLLPYLPPDPELCSVSPVIFSVFVELLDQAVSVRKQKGQAK